jgi:predicted DNA-binding transcriptional regulator AlpA
VSHIAQQMSSDILYTEEVAALARKPVATIRWLRAIGRGPRSGKLGNRVIYKRADVEAWIDAAFENTEGEHNKP